MEGSSRECFGAPNLVYTPEGASKGCNFSLLALEGLRKTNPSCTPPNFSLLSEVPKPFPLNNDLSVCLLAREDDYTASIRTLVYVSELRRVKFKV